MSGIAQAERVIRPGTGTNSRELSAIAASTAKICNLPAVATLDWCDRAASALADLYRPAVACVLIATVDAHGRILELEAAGVGSNSDGEEANVTKALSLVDSEDPTPRNNREAQLNDMRCRAERLSTIGFAPGESIGPDGMCAPISQLPGGWGWRSSGMGPMWSWMGAGEVLVGLIRLGNVVAGRSVVAYVAPGARTEAVEHRAALLEVALPLLARKALAAIGPQRSSRSRWISPREQVVLDQLILGKSVRQIAEELGRSSHTVHDHVKALHRKLNASSRGELISRALGYLTECSRVRHPKTDAVREVKPAVAGRIGPTEPRAVEVVTPVIPDRASIGQAATA
ncbi:MAG: helix-turn-helix transcriptional regulator [Planctomycetota bacterium]|nr:helix-turn-helix transcriptional regulator [Planctomycetota bacterium]